MEDLKIADLTLSQWRIAAKLAQQMLDELNLSELNGVVDSSDLRAVRNVAQQQVRELAGKESECYFTSLTTDFNNPDFQADLKRLNIRTERVEDTPEGFPEYTYTGRRVDLEAIIAIAFGNEDSILEAIQEVE